ncbi:hypothetical protein [Streptomyces sp. RKAG290]|uniref:hypothetical protein n=1 Tax=Streptomyces sp. RKAG290 TaxID=2888348 RepID=UPI0020347CFF|nr:hypothetical protein [Streptomyces sp. RKAG290]MCM2411358.1 hypothetical protein [Streptomyces sp. RKAG290]
MRRTGTTRRGALTATGAIALGAAVAGCTSGADDQAGSRKGSPRTAADRASADLTDKSLRTSALHTSGALLAQYEHVLRAYPSTAAGLSPLRDAVRARTKALSPGTGEHLGLVRSRADGPAAAVRELAASERSAADAHTAALLKAPPELARLLASLAAAASAHAYLLTELAKETTA